MHRSIIFMSVLLACLFGLSQQTTSRRGITFDKDTFSGSGGGGGGSDVTFEDDEDLADISGSGSGSGEGSGQIAETLVISTYVVTINISSQSFSPELADKGSELFHITAKRIRQDLEGIWAFLPGEQNVKILSFSQGSLMTTFELQDTGNSHPEKPKQVLVDTLKKGRLGENRVSLTGFAFKPVNTAVKPPRMTPTSTTTSRPLTMCERMRETRRRLAGSKYLPRCEPNGEFESLQCSKHVGTDDCWCSDLDGIEIPGTRMEAPNFPDCETGYNMAPCVYKLVLHIRGKMLGSPRPRCALDGQFESIQCHGSVCFCVYEESGTRIDGTEVHIPATPNCDDELETTPSPVNRIDWGKPKEEEKTTVEVPTEPEIVFPKETPPPPFNGYEKDEKTTGRTTEPEIIFPSEGKDSVVVEEGGSKEDGRNTININIGKNNEDKNREESEENKTGGDSEEVDMSERTETKSRVKENTILTQPGLLGGIIGGSVVLLLGLVLLIMFIVYRMRKKDEGSYPLDEPRKSPNYSYVRAPEKEYYA